MKTIDTLTPAQLTRRNKRIVELVRQGWSYSTLARKYGISRGRIGQIVQKLDPRAADHWEPRAKIYAKFAERVETANICPVCGYWNLRGPHTVTCSSDCSTVYLKIRDLLDPSQRDQWRQATAQKVLASGDPKQIEWAKRVLAGEPPNRRYFHKRSQRRRLARVLGLLVEEPLPESRETGLYP